ncbi:hypothetical protein INR49_030708 [Caranx melampygus]|nr:hypothetical protein INR49_030708 [Caranx melampygus]
MVGRGFHSDFLNSKCSSCAGHPQLLVLALILAHYTTVSVQVLATHGGGVHGLDCFGKYKRPDEKTCVWRPGNHSSERTYTLVILQPRKKYCKSYSGITRFSQTVSVYKKYNMTAEVYQHSESRNCTKAVFSDLPDNLWRCGPPYNVSFRRQSQGKLLVTVSWPEDDKKSIELYSVRYKALGDLQSDELSVQCKNAEQCTAENLSSSLVYVVQIQCVTNSKCTQCPWSVYNGFYVIVGKASGERPHDRIHTTQPEITLILSYSSYRLSISAVNNASTSPPESLTVPQREEDILCAADRKLSVTVHSNTSFTISWKDDLIQTYVCYSVEWRANDNKTEYMSFYQDENNNMTLSLSGKPLEPYKRYSITLHVRPEKDTCNMKHINNSESTYGTTQFYLSEGTPVGAPSNVSAYNVTLTSAVLQWLSIPEDDLRGFLLGYVIHYAEYTHTRMSTEKNLTVDPKLDTYELQDLKSDTSYHVQISGVTRAGPGVRSTPYVFKTNQQGYFNVNRIGIITFFVVVVLVLLFGSPLIKRAKVILWPSIPNPVNSNAMQKLERPFEMELLESISTMKMVEWDTSSLQLVEKETTFPSMLPLLHDSEDEGPETTGSNWIQRDSEDADVENLPEAPADTTLNVQQTNFQSSPFVFSTGYTTMEMLQQVMPQASSVNTQTVTQAMDSDAADVPAKVVRSGLDYVRQLSTSPTLGSEMTRCHDDNLTDTASFTDHDWD